MSLNHPTAAQRQDIPEDLPLVDLAEDERLATEVLKLEADAAMLRGSAAEAGQGQRWMEGGGRCRRR